MSIISCHKGPIEFSEELPDQIIVAGLGLEKNICYSFSFWSKEEFSVFYTAYVCAF
jgi:hypothetical protein